MMTMKGFICMLIISNKFINWNNYIIREHCEGKRPTIVGVTIHSAAAYIHNAEVNSLLTMDIFKSVNIRYPPYSYSDTRAAHRRHPFVVHNYSNNIITEAHDSLHGGTTKARRDEYY